MAPSPALSHAPDDDDLPLLRRQGARAPSSAGGAPPPETLPAGFHRASRSFVYCERCGGRRGGFRPGSPWRETATHARLHPVGLVMERRFARGQVPAYHPISGYLTDSGWGGLVGEHDQWGTATLKEIGYAPPTEGTDAPDAPTVARTTEGDPVAETLPWSLKWFARAELEDVLPAVPQTARSTRQWLHLLLAAQGLAAATASSWWMAVMAVLLVHAPRVRSETFAAGHTARLRVGAAGASGAVDLDFEEAAAGELLVTPSGSRWTRDPTIIARTRQAQRVGLLPGGRHRPAFDVQFDGDRPRLLVDRPAETVLPIWLRPLPLAELDTCAPLAATVHRLAEHLRGAEVTGRGGA